MNAIFNTLLLYVKDIKTLKQFYTENFGLQVIEEDDVWVLLNAGTATIGFHKIGDHYIHKINPDHKVETNTKMVFEIDEAIEKVRNNFISKNIEMREIKTFENYNFWLCDGIDPEGKVFQLKSRKN